MSRVALFVAIALAGLQVCSAGAQETSPYPHVIATGQTSPHLCDLIAAADDEDAGQVIVFDSTRVVVEASGLSHRYQHTLHKILTADGVRAASAQRFDYDPASNMISIQRVRVHHADSSFTEIDPQRFVDCFAPAYMIYWGGRMKLLTLPRLAVGDAVELRTYKKGFQIAYLAQVDVDEERYIPPMRGHFYDVLLFADHHPLRVRHYELVLPRDKPVHFSVYNGEVYAAMSYTDSSLVYAWWAKDQEAAHHEPRQPDWSDFVPKVVLATVPDWPEKSRWFFDVNDPVFAWNDEIQAKVDELTRGLDSDEERMAVLLHWVADNIRYSGLNMGEGEGYTLHPSIMTWEERCGVCKDIAGMLVTMLRAAGYTTYPAMTMAGSRVEAVPADQFNHCVVAVEREDGTFVMLDPTWAPHSRDTWSRAEGEQHYVIGSPAGEERCAIRSFAAGESPLTIALETRLDERGGLEGKIDVVGDGYMDSRLRRSLSYRPPSAWHAYLTGWLQSISPALEVTESEFADYRDYAQPMRYRARFRVPGYAVVSDSLIDCAVPSLRLLAGCQRFLRVIDLPEVEDRQHPALFWATGLVDIEEEMRLPRGYEFAPELPACEVYHDAAFLEIGTEAKGKTLHFHHRMALEKRTVPPGEWPQLAEVSDSLRSLAATRLQGSRR